MVTKVDLRFLYTALATLHPNITKTYFMPKAPTHAYTQAPGTSPTFFDKERIVGNSVEIELPRTAINFRNKLLTHHEQRCRLQLTLCTQYRNTHGTDPVKLIPARSGDPVIAFPKTGPSAGTKLTTPGGTPASVMIL